MQQQFTDKDIAGDVLTGTKHMVQRYMHAVLESQDQNLRQTFMDYHNQCLTDQHQMFQLMNKNGWYKVPMILDENQSGPQS
jgi:spore coat protein CotF